MRETVAPCLREGEEEEVGRQRRERELGALFTEKEEKPKKRGSQNYKNAPPSSISIPNCSMLDTASLFRIQISKPKSII